MEKISRAEFMHISAITKEQTHHFHAFHPKDQKVDRILIDSTCLEYRLHHWDIIVSYSIKGLLVLGKDAVSGSLVFLTISSVCFHSCSNDGFVLLFGLMIWMRAYPEREVVLRFAKGRKRIAIFENARPPKKAKLIHRTQPTQTIH
jgi:hypothetical protein